MGDATVDVIDISNPATPVLVSTLSSGIAAGRRIAVSGKYAYLMSSTFLDVIDISNPLQLVRVGGFNLPGSAGARDIAIQGTYAYIAGSAPGHTSGTLFVVNIADPTSPTTVGSYTFTGGFGPPPSLSVDVQGSYAYVTRSSGSINNLYILDISEASSPTLQSTLAMSDRVRGVTVSGRYAYVANQDDTVCGSSCGWMDIVDVSSPSDPLLINHVEISGSDSQPESVVISGRHALITQTNSDEITVVDIRGIETNGFIAHSALVSNLVVMNDAQFSNSLSISGGLTIGNGGILSLGALAISSTNTTSTISFAMTSPILEVTRRLSVSTQIDTEPSAMIANSASNAVAVLQVSGGCSDVDGATDLFLVGNTTDPRKFSVRCDGTVLADGAYSGAGADFAEYFRKSSSTILLSGEVVALDSTTGTTSTVVLAQDMTRARTLGVVATKAGFLGNAAEGRALDPEYVAVSLHGQVPVKASAIGGSIEVGDELMAGANGIAVKARGPGMILGRALEALASGTSTLSLYVNPQWWAGDLLGTDGSGNVLLKESLTVASSTMASVSTALVDSPYFTFLSRAWNESSLTAVHSEFRLFADAINASTSLFTVANASGTSLLTISDMGDMTVNGKLYLSNKSSQLGSTSTYLFVDDTAPGSVMIATNADGFQTSSTYDYAERFPSVDQLEAGELVMIDPIAGTNYLKRTVSVRDTVIGIVSTKPGFLTGAYSTGTYPIALAGRVPTKVTVANGAIQAGDALTVSDIPGVAQKFQGQGSIVGYALQAYSGLEIGLISVFVKTGGAMGSVIAEPVSSSVDRGERLTGLAKILGGQYSVQVYFAASLNAYPLITVTPYGAVEKGYWVSQVTDTGFTIQVSEPVIADTVFSWTVMPALEGDRMSLSDNTSEPFDPLTGQIVQPTAGIIEEPLPEIESPVIEE